MSATTTAPTTFRADRFRKVYGANMVVPGDHFDMRHERADTSCGTVSCAFGTYVIAHPEEGATFYETKGFLSPPGVTLHGVQVPECSYSCAWNDKIAVHLGIAPGESEYLFDFYRYEDPSKRNVLARLRAFAAERGLELPEYQGD